MTAIIMTAALNIMRQMLYQSNEALLATFRRMLLQPVGQSENKITYWYAASPSRNAQVGSTPAQKQTHPPWQPHDSSRNSSTTTTQNVRTTEADTEDQRRQVRGIKQNSSKNLCHSLHELVAINDNSAGIVGKRQNEKSMADP